MIKIYSTPTCSKCDILKKRLKSKEIEFETIEDLDHMKKLGLSGVPAIEIDGVLHKDFAEIMKIITKL